MTWAIAAALAVILIYRFFSKPSRRARALCFAIMRARSRKHWARAAHFCAKSHDLAGRVKEPFRSRLQSHIEIQWGEILYRQGKLREAGEMIQRGLAKGERHYAPHSEMLLVGYRCWGDLCSDEGRLSEAEGYYRRALAGHETADDEAGVMFDLQRLGECLIRQERQDEAEPVLQRAVATETRSARASAVKRGMDPDQCQITPISLPNLHFCRKEYEDAGRLFRAQVERWEAQVNRPDNIDIGDMQMKVAQSEARSGNVEQAIQAYERAAVEFEREWCEGHPRALAARHAKAALGAGVTSSA